jgi:pimeloyl-ACP methyl ester carboxylesterase
VTGEAAFREHRISAQDGLRLHVRDYGDTASRPTPLLCLAGLTRNSADFDRVAERFAASRRVVCPDYRGRGRSEWDRDWRNYDPAVYLSDIGQVMAALGLERVVVIGVSMGGLLGLGLAALKPLSVAGLVLNDIGPDVAPGGLGRILEFIGTDRPQPDWEAAARFLRHALPTVRIRTDEGWERFARASYKEGPDGLLHFAWDVNLAKKLAQQKGPGRDLWPVFRGARRLPMLVLRGALSDVLSADCLERMADAAPTMRHLTVPEWGHCPPLDEAPVDAVLDAFLAAL